uniref:Uncharacterized protein n=1 Tax=Globisporangium ultimum (strain ATCC 200006 / CBS 805.95 / DAOM BR144) TaxID=431595 RepID=K3WRK0_GLOUD
MTTHLAHRLPWVSLCDVVDHGNKLDKGRNHVRYQEKHVKIVRHFTRCLSDAIKEFAATDKSTDETKWSRNGTSGITMNTIHSLVPLR